MKWTVLAAACALIVSAPALAADHGGGAAFKIRDVGNAVVTPTADGLAVAATGTMTGTELGAGTWSDSEFAAFDPTGQLVIHGTATFTAANGDQLTMTYDTTTPLPDATGNVHPQGTFTITGGTGRFANATGGGTVAVDANVAGPLTGTFAGTIDLH